MSVASELHTSLRSMGFVQLLLAIVFLTCYSVACSTLFGGRGRARATAVALLSAAGFVALTHPWVHGVLLVAGAIGGLGLFAAMAWLSSTALNVARFRSAESEDAIPADATEPAPLGTPARAPQHGTRIPAA